MNRMRKIQKILGGIFLAGVLLGGVGTGIAMVEYSSLAYGGEKLIGEDSLVTKTLDFDFDLDGRILEIEGGRYWGTNKGQEIEVDNTVPAGTVRFEVTYNQKTVTPSLAFQVYEEDETEKIWEEQQDTEYEQVEWEEPEAELESQIVQMQEEDTDSLQPLGEQDAADRSSGTEEETEDLPQEKKEPGKMGTVYLTASYHENGFATLMENKDYMLEELKQGKISSYSMAYITDVKISVNQETVPYIEGCYVIY